MFLASHLRSIISSPTFQAKAARRVFALLLWALVASVPRLSLAENQAAAEVLFSAGRDAMGQGDYDIACDKFLESSRLDPAAGTLLNLAHCEEKRGHFATSWRRYTEAIDLLKAGDKRLAFARNKARALEPKVPRLTINLQKESPGDARVRRNGHAIGSELGVPVRLDPGSYTIVVDADGYESSTYQVILGAGDRRVINVRTGGVLEPLSTPPAPRVLVTDVIEKDSSRETVGYVFGGTGIVAGLAAATFGVLTYQKYQVVRDHCDLERDICFDDVGQNAAETGARYEILAYTLGAVGVASLTVGTYLLLSDDDEGATAVAEVGTFGSTQGVRIRGSF